MFVLSCLVFILWCSCGIAVPLGVAAKPIIFSGSLKCRFPWQAWPFVTFSSVWESVESRCVWQMQYFGKVFRRWLACIVAGAALWRPPSSFCMACAALWTCPVACFILRLALSGLRQVVTTYKLRGRRGASWECHFAWQAQSLGHFRHCDCCFPHWHGYVRCNVAFLYRAILRGRRSTW